MSRRLTSRWVVLVAGATILLPTPMLGQTVSAEQQPVTVAQAIRFALERNPQLAAARYMADAAGAQQSFRQRARLPNLSFSSFLEYFPVEDKLQTPRHMDIPATMGPDMLDFFRQQFQTTVFNLQATLSQPIYTGGLLAARASAAGHVADAAEASATASSDAVIFDVAAGYYAVLRLQKVVAATEATVRSLEESARIVERQVEVGRAAPVDLYRIRTRLANTRQELIRRTGALAKATTLLRVTMGLEEALQPIALVDTLAYVPRHYDLAAGIEEALRRRPDYEAQAAMVQARGQMVRAAIAGYVPHVSLNAFYRQDYGSTSRTWRDDAGIFVSVSFNFLNPVNPAAVGEARAGQRAEEQRLQRLRLEIIRQVETAYLDVGEAERRIAAAETALQEARETVRIEQRRLEVGRGIVNDLLDAEAELLQAEVNYATALADHNVAVFALERAMGEISYEALLAR